MEQIFNLVYLTNSKDVVYGEYLLISDNQMSQIRKRFILTDGLRQEGLIQINRLWIEKIIYTLTASQINRSLA